MVMGDMGEVGDQGPQFHDEAGRHARALGIEKLFTLGEQSKQAAAGFGGTQVFGSMDELAAAVLAELPHTGSVLVKGSRFMKMERVVQAITAHAQDHAQHNQNHKEEPHAA
jgi:UDP-N-acetylmuramoyl-tripeptide--D-alanyl-D-alanine ligase